MVEDVDIHGLLSIFEGRFEEHVILATYLECGDGHAALERLLGLQNNDTGEETSDTYAWAPNVRPGDAEASLEAFMVDAPLQELQLNFPEVDPEILKQVLESEGNDPRAATAAILAQLRRAEEFKAPDPLGWEDPSAVAPATLAELGEGSAKPSLDAAAMPVPIPLPAQGCPAADNNSALLGLPFASASPLIPQCFRDVATSGGVDLLTPMPWHREEKNGTKGSSDKAWHEERQAEFAFNRAKLADMQDRIDAVTNQAIEANRAGNLLEAGRLHIKVSKLKQEKRELTMKIRDRTMARVNERHTSPEGVYELPTMDLHCQTVPGAISKLNASWDFWAAAPGVYNVPCKFKIITGRGCHSRDGKAKIAPAVEAWLAEKGVAREWAEDGGSVIVHLRRPPCPCGSDAYLHES